MHLRKWWRGWWCCRDGIATKMCGCTGRLRIQQTWPRFCRHRRQELRARRFPWRHVQVRVASLRIVWGNRRSVIVSLARSRRCWGLYMLLSLCQVAHQLLPELVNVEVWTLSSNKFAFQCLVVGAKFCNLCSHLLDDSLQLGDAALLIDFSLVLDRLCTLTET